LTEEHGEAQNAGVYIDLPITNQVFANRYIESVHKPYHESIKERKGLEGRSSWDINL
jgi:hypothetical protein